jgi:2-polyprenyl-6-methoxyphenol hydroxylase-like FAD-dependent oxidoreductase
MAVMEKQRVAVVGLGIAGTLAATLLARDGHDVTVFEQCPEPGPVGAGILLQPSGQRVLERLGLMHEVVAGAERIERLTAFTHRGRTLIDLGYGELGAGTCAYGLHRGDLFSLLYRQALAAGVKVQLGCAVERIAVKPDAAEVVGAAGPLGRFDFVVAADGGRSPIRAASGVAHRAHVYPHGALWATGRCAAVTGRLWQVTEGSKRLCGVLPMGGGRASLFWSLAKHEQAAFYARGFAAWREEVVSLCAEAAEFFETLTCFEQTRLAGYSDVTMGRPWGERLVFIGDAAHAMSPHLGQGINLALLDAYVLAGAVREGRDFPQACARYAAERRRHVRTYALLTRCMSPFFQSRGVVKGKLRDLGLPVMPRVPWLRREMVLTMSGLRAGLWGGRLAVGGQQADGPV